VDAEEEGTAMEASAAAVDGHIQEILSLGTSLRSPPCTFLSYDLLAKAPMALFGK